MKIGSLALVSAACNASALQAFSICHTMFNYGEHLADLGAMGGGDVGACSGVVLGLIAATPALALDNMGHMTIAQVAWNGLTPEVRTKVSQLLRLNPQYVFWTVNVAAEKRDQIVFLRASVWADFIKNDPRYKNDGTKGGNRPPPGPEAGQNIGYSDSNRHRYWHFIDKRWQTLMRSTTIFKYA